MIFVPLTDNCITISPDILNSNYIISEHIYIYTYIYIYYIYIIWIYTSEIVLYVCIAQVIQCYPGAIFIHGCTSFNVSLNTVIFSETLLQ